MKITPANIEKFLKVLEQIPHRISDAVVHLDEERLYLKLDKKSWSANDILAHLRSCADVWGDSIRSMLAEDNPKLPDIHPLRWIKRTDYTELDFHKSLKAYSSQRRELLRTSLLRIGPVAQSLEEGYTPSFHKCGAWGNMKQNTASK